MTQRISLQEMPKGLVDGMLKTEFYLKKSGLDQQLLNLMQYRRAQIEWGKLWHYLAYREIWIDPMNPGAIVNTRTPLPYNSTRKLSQ